MYKEIFEKYKSYFPAVPAFRRPRVGSVIRDIRINKGIQQKDLAKLTGINESTLKSIINDHQQATTVENLDHCAKALGVTTDELILRGRERDPANFFAFKNNPPPEIEGIRKRKHSPEDWHQSIQFNLKNCQITPISAPINTKKDFLCFRLEIPPKHKFDKLILESPMPVIGFVSKGFNIKISYGGKIDSTITSNQGFMLNGFHQHSLINEDDEHPAIIYLITKLPHLRRTNIDSSISGKEFPAINIAQGIELIRKYCSERPEQMISVKHLADLTDSLNHSQIAMMMEQKKGSSVVYWEKIEDLLGAAKVPIEDFLEWTHNKQSLPFSMGTSSTRAWIKYTHFGAKLYSCTPPGIKNFFFCAELFLDGAGQIRRESLRRKDESMIALYVEEGELLVTAGRERMTLPLSKGDRLYFDGNLSYMLQNPSRTQAQIFLASYPGIQI